MPLSPEQLKQRILAAAALHGWRMADLPDKLEEFGAQKHLAAGLADGRLSPRPASITTLANFFGVPERWFTEEDHRQLIAEEQSMPPAAELGLQRQQEGLRMMREGLTALERIEARQVRQENPPIEAELPATKADLQRLELELYEALAGLHKELQASRTTQGRGAKGRASDRR